MPVFGWDFGILAFPSNLLKYNKKTSRFNAANKQLNIEVERRCGDCKAGFTVSPVSGH